MDLDDESINANICSMCFVHYEDNVLDGSEADWIFCKCGRWLHEDCIEDAVKDNDDERYCSLFIIFVLTNILYKCDFIPSIFVHIGISCNLAYKLLNISVIA